MVNELDVPRPPECRNHDAFVEWAIDVSPDNSDSLFPDTFLWNIALYLPEEESDLCSPRIRRMRLLRFKSSSSATAVEETTASLLKLLRTRSQQEGTNSFLDLRSLSGETVTVAMAMATSLLKKEIDRQSTPNPKIAIDWSPWMEDCVYILLSLTAQPIPRVAEELLSSLLGPVFVSRTQGFLRVLTARVPVTSPDVFSHVIQRLHGTLSIPEGGYLLGHLELLMQHYFCPPGANHEHKELIDVIRVHPEIPSQDVSAMVKSLMSLTKNAVVSMEGTIPSWTVVAKIFLFQLYDLDTATLNQCRADIVDFARFFLLRWRDFSSISNPMFSMYGTWYELIRESAREASIQAAVSSSPSELSDILGNFRAAAYYDANSRVFSEDDKVPDHCNRVDPLHASLVFLRLLQALRENGTSLEEHANVIRGFFTAIEEGLETVADMRQLWKGDYRASAIRCLELVSELDVSESPADEDCEAFDERTQKPSMPDDTLFSDSFIEKIALYLPGPQEEFLVSCRIRRLLLPRTVSGDKPIAEATVIPSLPSNSSALPQSASPSPQRIPRSQISHIEPTSSEPELGEQPAPASGSESVPVDSDGQGTPLRPDLAIGVGSRTDDEIPKHRDDKLDDGRNGAKAPEELASARSDAKRQASTRANMNEASGSGMGGQGDPDEVDFVEHRPELAGAMEVGEVGDTEIGPARRNGQPEAGHGGGFSVSTDMDA
ncbi:hypothetical protein BC629DRAFT_243366 [Irpex lacteus]|nr:hypothetical protein BC629DRAFT_243366 [Irpex lacteus]